MIYVMDILSFSDEFTEEIRKAVNHFVSSGNKKRDNKDSVCGRALLGYILNSRYGKNSAVYRYGENGKPYLEDENIFFNISHSGHYVVCCFSSGEIGCDIEKVKEFKPSIPKRFFTEKEAKSIEECRERERVFTRLWTLKESILKKDGTGITGGLDSYCFADNIYEDNFTAFGNKFFCCSLDGYELSVCSSENFDDRDVVFVLQKEMEAFVKEINYEKA